MGTPACGHGQELLEAGNLTVGAGVETNRPTVFRLQVSAFRLQKDKRKKRG